MWTFFGKLLKDEQVDLNVMDPTFRHNLEKTGATVQNGIGKRPLSDGLGQTLSGGKGR